MTTRLLAILAHPSQESFNAALHAAYVEGAREFVQVDELDLSELDFDPLLRAGFDESQVLEPDLERARRHIERAQHVSWFFPTWWAATPALLKGFVDRTFLPGWAFRYEKGKALPTPLLAGRTGRVVTTMDSPGWWYRFWHRRSVHASFINATLRFVGFAKVRHTTLHGVRAMSEQKRRAAIETMKRRGVEDAKRLVARALKART
ncbi:MAG: NAD(P)H dehydrogenase (quinone) [Polyangiales bacterium]|jgi:NAD(P)H dehydrogenase (quinone)